MNTTLEKIMELGAAEDRACSETERKLIINEAEELYNKHLAELNLLNIPVVSGMLSDQTKRHIDLAYLTGVFNVSGIDGLQKELTRLKEIGKNPHDILSEGNYR